MRRPPQHISRESKWKSIALGHHKWKQLPFRFIPELKSNTYGHVVYRPRQIWGWLWFAGRAIGSQAVANIESAPVIVYLHKRSMFWYFWKINKWWQERIVSRKCVLTRENGNSHVLYRTVRVLVFGHKTIHFIITFIRLFTIIWK